MAAQVEGEGGPVHRGGGGGDVRRDDRQRDRSAGGGVDLHRARRDEVDRPQSAYDLEAGEHADILAGPGPESQKGPDRDVIGALLCLWAGAGSNRRPITFQAIARTN